MEIRVNNIEVEKEYVCPFILPDKIYFVPTYILIFLDSHNVVNSLPFSISTFF